MAFLQNIRKEFSGIANKLKPAAPYLKAAGQATLSTMGALGNPLARSIQQSIRPPIVPRGTFGPAIPSSVQSSGTMTSTPSMVLPKPSIAPPRPAVSTPTSPSPTKPVSPAVAPPSAPQGQMQTAMMPTGNVTTPSGVNVNPATGGVVSAQQPQAPQVAPPPQAAQPAQPTVPDYISEAEKAYQQSSQMTPEEELAQAELDRLNESYNLGLSDISEQAIPLGFITGQQAALERRMSGKAQTLEQQLARAQAKRMSATEASKFALERADARLAQEQKANQPFSISEGETYGRFNPQTGQFQSIFSAPKDAADSGFTLSEGQARYDAEGNLIAGREKTTTGKEAEVLSPTEAQQLGVPYGTTREQAYGLSATGKPTVEQSKARQFSVAASNADQVLNSIGYNPGWVELPWVPNVIKGPERQQFEQAARAFVNATLRRESGATITDSEFQNKYRELIPQAGDSEQVKVQKQAARAAAVQSITEAGGEELQGDAAQGGFNW